MNSSAVSQTLVSSITYYGKGRATRTQNAEAELVQHLEICSNKRRPGRGWWKLLVIAAEDDVDAAENVALRMLALRDACISEIAVADGGQLVADASPRVVVQHRDLIDNKHSHTQQPLCGRVVSLTHVDLAFQFHGELEEIVYGAYFHSGARNVDASGGDACGCARLRGGIVCQTRLFVQGCGICCGICYGCVF